MTQRFSRGGRRRWRRLAICAGLALLAEGRGSGVAAQTPPSLAGAASADGKTTPTVIQLDVDPGQGVLASPFAYDPNTPPPFNIAPPLSLYESRLMLDSAKSLLQPEPAAEVVQREGRADFMLASVVSYIRWIDETHTTLPYYSWDDLADAKLRSTSWLTYAFRTESSPRGVTALSLKAHHGDVEVMQIAVLDADNKEWQFNRRLALKGDQPRATICFLALPVKIAEIRLRCRDTSAADDSERPHLFVQAGVCARPESAKQAVYYAQRARFALRSGDFDLARASIDQASALLLKYQKDRPY